MKKKIELTESQAKEMYYNINSFYLFLQSAENIDKCFFDQLKFWNPTLNNHMGTARRSIGFIKDSFNNHFNPKDNDLVQYEAPAELHRVMDFFVRLAPETISEIMDQLENKRDEMAS